MTDHDNNGSRLVSVLEANNELEAITIQAFLESQGIEAAIRSRQIPMYDGIAKVWNPVWGYVMVMEEDREKAERLIVEYMDSCSNGEDYDYDEYLDEDMDL
ncbi:MAG: DUF2007 domain-containing protein [Candidatus Fermentibacteraceae bacterium]|nr:DUF2007 domain-containing protein [Candidatus Fermentibacteraceae bacterium]MBN2609625.1 DUF2007 domain-containing protein [Candidatus Fermentibacteraceae bacterium]